MHNLTALNCLPPLALVVQSQAGSAVYHLWSAGLTLKLIKDIAVYGCSFNSWIPYVVWMLTREVLTKGPKSPPVVKEPIR